TVLRIHGSIIVWPKLGWRSIIAHGLNDARHWKPNSMPTKSASRVALKKTLKEALAETLHEQRELLQEVFSQVLEDVALAEAIRAGRKSKPVSRLEAEVTG